MDAQMNQVLFEKARLNVLRELALIDSPRETLYDRITTAASQIVGAPVSLISMVGGDYQFFKSQHGLPEPWKSNRRTPLSHSFCKHVVATNEPLIVEDAREHPVVHDNMAIPDLDVIGYLGMPLTLQDGKRLGSFCVIDNSPREWTPLEIDIVREFAEIVTHEIDIRALAAVDAKYQAKLDEAHQKIDAVLNGLDMSLPKTQMLAKIRETRQTYELH